MEAIMQWFLLLAPLLQLLVKDKFIENENNLFSLVHEHGVGRRESLSDAAKMKALEGFTSQQLQYSMAIQICH